jgi:hypothetical protein
MVERNVDGLDKDQEDLSPLMDRFRPYLEKTVEQTVSEFSLKEKTRDDVTSKELHKLSSAGLVRLVDGNPPKSLWNYLFSFYSLWFWVVVAFLSLTVSSILLIPQSYPFNYLRAITGLIFPLYLPGYVLIEAIYPSGGGLGRLERFLLGIGLSLALVPLTGLALNYIAGGILLVNTLVALTLIVIGLGLLSVYRKYRLAFH